MQRLLDDRRRELVFARPPRRIVSLVPSDTDSLFALGAGELVVGRTRFCVEPAGQVEAIPVCGGTKDVDVDQVLALAPDLILANQEENTRGDLERLATLGLPVFVGFPKRVADGFAHLARLAQLLGRAREPAVVALVRSAYAALRTAEQETRPPIRAFVPIWSDPLMTMAGDTFGSDVMALAGAANVFADRVRRYPLAADLGQGPPLPADRVAGRDTRYPRITTDEVIARAPELVLLPDEPYRFTEADADAYRALPIPAAARGAVHLCDGKDLFWYGARSVGALARLRSLVYFR